MNDSAPKQEPPYGLRMPPELKERVKRAAASSNRSMNAEIVATLEEKYPAPPEEDAFIEKLKEHLETLPPEQASDMLRTMLEIMNGDPVTVKRTPKPGSIEALIDPRLKRDQ